MLPIVFMQTWSTIHPWLQSLTFFAFFSIIPVIYRHKCKARALDAKSICMVHERGGEGGGGGFTTKNRYRAILQTSLGAHQTLSSTFPLFS